MGERGGLYVPVDAFLSRGQPAARVCELRPAPAFGFRHGWSVTTLPTRYQVLVGRGGCGGLSAAACPTLTGSGFAEFPRKNSGLGRKKKGAEAPLSTTAGEISAAG